jgi:adenylate cyclase
MERKLTAILCTDVYGYSRLMSDDEEATFRTLASHRKIIDALIEQHHGRFVNSAGDSVLAEFASVVNAVQCAVEIQNTLRAENAEVPPDRRMQFRIGVNLGDVMVEGEQIYGDGVNVAARLESLAEPGGICISGKVHDETKGKLPLSYVDLGVHRVKNIAEPVHVWRVPLDGAAPVRRSLRIARSYWRGGVLSLAGLAIILATIVLVQHVSLKPPRTSASIPPPAKPALALPDKPSIAVMPFINMSGDREQEYFSDGITDDLITDLSRLPGLFVIARDSTFTYKGKAAKLQDVGRELGVKYVMEGSVRKAADQLRITVQLADATTGDELWAERYDRPLRDVFALQDEIVRRIVTTLNLQIALSQQGFVIPRRTENLEAYDDLLRGVGYDISWTKSGILKARQLFERAIALDPNYADAYASLGDNYFSGYVLALNAEPDALDRALHLEQQANALDDSLSGVHAVRAYIYVQKNQHDQALTEAQRAIALDPNSAFGYLSLAEVLNSFGKSSEALAAAQKAMRLDPRNSVTYLWQQGWAYSQLGRWEEAIPALRGSLSLHPDFIWAHAWLAVDYYNLGDRGGARAETRQVERLVALTPDSAVGYSALAFALDGQGQPVEALVVAEKGVRVDPQNRAILLWWLGNLYNQVGRWEESASAVKHYVAISPKDAVSPNDIWPHALLVEDYAALGQMDASRQEAAQVQRLAELDSNSNVRYLPLAITLEALGEEAEALVELEKGMRFDPGNRGGYLWLQGHAYSQLGRWEDAISAFKSFLGRYPQQVLPRVELAVDYIEVGRDDDARAEVAEALRLDPQFSLKMGVEDEFPMDKERAVADLRKAGLR